MFVEIDDDLTPNDTSTSFISNALAATFDAKHESLIQEL
jgi:hypothetical protein